MLNVMKSVVIYIVNKRYRQSIWAFLAVTTRQTVCDNNQLVLYDDQWKNKHNRNYEEKNYTNTVKHLIEAGSLIQAGGRGRSNLYSLLEVLRYKLYFTMAAATQTCKVTNSRQKKNNTQH